MSDNPRKSWSNAPWAPQLTPRQYSGEKTYLVGYLIGSILYGIVIILFFQCMRALLNPADRIRGGIRPWWLVAHATAMFSIVTLFNAASFDYLVTSYIDNRGFPGDGGIVPPGPFGYQLHINLSPVTIVPVVAFSLNQWLADGLLLYRCYIIYGMNYWVIAFPCLAYLISIAMGTVYIYRGLVMPEDQAGRIDFGVPSYAISFSLSVLLTFMIVARLVLHNRRIQDTMGSQVRPGGLYKASITILVESYALFTVSHLLFLAPWAAGHRIANVFLQIFVQMQPIAPFLIILRVANRRALTSEVISPDTIGTIHFRSQGKSTGGDGAFSDGCPMSLVDTNAETLDELGEGVENTIDEVPSSRGQKCP